MSVRSTNSSASGLVNRPAAQEKPAAPAPEKNTAVEKPASQPGRVENHFERGEEINRTFSRSYSTDRPMYTPKLPSSGFGGALAGLLGKLPKVGIDGSFEKSAAAHVAQGSFGDPNSVASGSGRVSFGEASISGSGEVSLEGGVVRARGDVQAKATLVDAEGQVRADLGPLHAEAQGKAWVGAKAGAHGELTIDPINGKYGARVGGDAFIGARAGVSGSVSLGEYGGVGGRAEAWAGVGVSARAEASLEGGRFKARFELGAALGIGFKLGFDIDINFGKIADAVTNIISKPVEVIKDVGRAVGNFFKGLFG